MNDDDITVSGNVASPEITDRILKYALWTFEQLKLGTIFSDPNRFRGNE